MDLHGMMQIDN